METKWTPGPWTLEIMTGTGAAADCTVAMIEQADQRSYRGMIARLQSAEHIDGIDAAELTANAHLLLAAPDMYAALDEALGAWNTHQKWGDGMDGSWASDARAALAKARGEA